MHIHILKRETEAQFHQKEICIQIIAYTTRTSAHNTHDCLADIEAVVLT